MKYSELEYVEFPEECMFAEPIVAYSRDAHKRVRQLGLFDTQTCGTEAGDIRVVELFGLDWNALHARIRWFGVINGNHRQNDKTQV